MFNAQCSMLNAPLGEQSETLATGGTQECSMTKASKVHKDLKTLKTLLTLKSQNASKDTLYLGISALDLIKEAFCQTLSHITGTLSFQSSDALFLL